MTTNNLLRYDKNDAGGWVINREPAETVRKIYCQFRAGKSTYKIAQQLTKDGAITRRGGTK